MTFREALGEFFELVQAPFLKEADNIEFGLVGNGRLIFSTSSFGSFEDGNLAIKGDEFKSDPIA